MGDVNKALTIAYVAKLSSPSLFDRFFGSVDVKPAQQVQKYHRLMAEGLAANENVDVIAIGAPPLSRAITKKVFFRETKLSEGGVAYGSPRLINIPILLQLSLFFGTFTHVRRACRLNKNNAVVCDILNVSMVAAALLAAKLAGAKTVGIVTDLPGFVKTRTSGLISAITNFLLSQFSHYVLLTEQMNAVVNKKKRPYVVVEGQADIRMKERENDLQHKTPGYLCMYAGSLNRANGIEILVAAFMEADISGAKLQIYGSGDYENQLKEMCKKNDNIKFDGAVSNEIVVEKQLKAALLVNPLPTNQEFTKYSFPSKTLECMVSGTPLLTTKLPGMPAEYYPYVYLLEDETVSGLKKALRDLLCKPVEELHEKGILAKAFILEQKNNIAQARKIVDMIEHA